MGEGISAAPSVRCSLLQQRSHGYGAPIQPLPPAGVPSNSPLTNALQVITSEHAGILLTYAAGAAVPPALYTIRRGWYVRRRVPIVACVRLALALCLAVPLPIPDVEPSSPAMFLWHLLLSGHGLYLSLLSIGMPLPLG